MSAALCAVRARARRQLVRRLCSHVSTSSRVISMWHWKPMCRSSMTNAWFAATSLVSMRVRHRRQVERVVVPLERREARQAAEPLAPRAAIARVDVRASRSRRPACASRARRAPSPSAGRRGSGRSPARRRAIASRSRRRAGAIHGSVVVDAHRAAHHADAGIRGGSSGTAAPSSSGTSSQGRPWRVSQCRSGPGLGRREAEDGDRRMAHAPATARIVVTSA